MALDPRPAEHFSRYHERVRTRDPDAVYSIVRMMITGPLLGAFRIRSLGVENVPSSGAVILAPNHFSFFDHFLLALYLRRKVRFMAKSELFKWPFDFIMSHGGSFPVRRGHNDVEAIRTAESILEREQVLAMYAEGGRSRSGKIGEPKRGLGRLALESGAPVVPVALHGTSEAKRLKRLRLPAKVTVQFGEPIAFPKLSEVSPEAALEASRKVFEQVKAMYDRLDELGRRAVIKSYRSTAALQS